MHETNHALANLKSNSGESIYFIARNMFLSDTETHPMLKHFRKANSYIRPILKKHSFKNKYDGKIGEVLYIYLQSAFFLSLFVSLSSVVIKLFNLANIYTIPLSLSFTSSLIAVAFSVLLQALLNKGHIKIVALTISISHVILPPIIILASGHIGNIAVLFYVPSLIISASILSWRYTQLFALLTFLSMGTMFLLASNNLMPTAKTPAIQGQFLTFVTCFSVILLMLKLETTNRNILNTSLDQLKTELIERKRIEALLNHSTLHDELTGLPNRKSLNDKINIAIEKSKTNPQFSFAVLFLDIDKFKSINDSLGHAAGDQTLVIFSKILKSNIREADTVGRLSGDEFVIVLNEVNDRSYAELIAENILNELKTPIGLKNEAIFLSSSIGIVLCNKTHNTVGELLKDADAAMYQSKENGRGRYTFFEGSIHHQPISKLNLKENFSNSNSYS